LREVCVARHPRPSPSPSPSSTHISKTCLIWVVGEFYVNSTSTRRQTWPFISFDLKINISKMDIRGNLAGIVAFVTLLVLIQIATINGRATVLRRCMGMSFGLACLLLLVPGLNLIAYLLLAVCAIMLMLDICTPCKLDAKVAAS